MANYGTLVEPAPLQQRDRQAAPWQQIGIELTPIPAGEFLYGDDRQPIWLAQFWIAKTPITNQQYDAFVTATGYMAPEHWPGAVIPAGKERHPVSYVTWQDAQTFCQWVGLHLPTEQQWEKAARGVDGRLYPWGNAAPDHSRCNFYYEKKNTTPVDQHPAGASPYGLLDMAGNVWEWCADWYDNQQQSRALRGGSFGSAAESVRCTARDWYRPDLHCRGLGFRVCTPTVENLPL